MPIFMLFFFIFILLGYVVIHDLKYKNKKTFLNIVSALYVAEHDINDVKIGIVGINDMFFFLHLIMHVTFGPIVLSCFTLICFFRFYLLPLFFGYGRLGSLLLFGCVGYKFGEPLSKALLLAKRFAFLKECLFKGRNLLYQSIYLVQESVVVIS